MQYDQECSNYVYINNNPIYAHANVVSCSFYILKCMCM